MRDIFKMPGTSFMGIRSISGIAEPFYNIDRRLFIFLLQTGYNYVTPDTLGYYMILYGNEVPSPGKSEHMPGGEQKGKEIDFVSVDDRMGKA